MRESEASAGEFPLVFDGLGVFRGHFYRVIDFPNPRQNCHRTTAILLIGSVFGLIITGVVLAITSANDMVL
ncbi:TPA: hypothetical protein RQ871_005133 [Pseudomonas aeruginosa]|nr:hypothetical protein [Pseudomonas aeruginosa]HCH0595915.1 hypothetical protein [Pseudomonas aeruginosa]HDY5996197.1 hypothetical protein [Pseudomonas aeruginosa]